MLPRLFPLNRLVSFPSPFHRQTPLLPTNQPFSMYMGHTEEPAVDENGQYNGKVPLHWHTDADNEMSMMFSRWNRKEMITDMSGVLLSFVTIIGGLGAGFYLATQTFYDEPKSVPRQLPYGAHGAENPEWEEFETKISNVPESRVEHHH